MKPQNLSTPRDIDGERKEQPVRGPLEMKRAEHISDLAARLDATHARGHAEEAEKLTPKSTAKNSS
jgi:hypothetical protein